MTRGPHKEDRAVGCLDGAGVHDQETPLVHEGAEARAHQEGFQEVLGTIWGAIDDDLLPLDYQVSGDVFTLNKKSVERRLEIPTRGQRVGQGA